MVERGIFYKEEIEKRPWIWIPYTKEALRQALASGAMYTTWTQFEFMPGNGHGEPKRYGHLPLDFDDKENPQNALNDLRALPSHLPEIYRIDPNCIRCCAFSTCLKFTESTQTVSGFTFPVQKVFTQ